ncbi:speriolin-like protein isoform X1 [Synchiropus splendidus]|uniref:speriolin-like protein isoform X1 n=1 Tax=Synchiropus splendidus TaxID=270530 RepID=UPI00237EC5FD|nr:speriolin-like protein isoform X1 [Synchiropus splendidus]
MDKINLEQTLATLVAKNQQLQQENDRMQNSMFNLFRENSELKARIQCKDSLRKSMGKNVSLLWPSSCNESQFRRHLKQSACEQRTSSPIDIHSFVLSYSMPRDPSAKAESECDADGSGTGASALSHLYSPPNSMSLAEEHRLIGEIAYQLDQRILGGIFQGRKRRYGYSLINIENKIREVSTNILTGVVDKGYQLHLTVRYHHLMKQLSQLGYKTSLHPSFSEIIVNTYGILVEQRTEAQQIEHNDPVFLRKFIKKNAPEKFQKDLIILLNCLCFLAEKDGLPLMMW